MLESANGMTRGRLVASVLAVLFGASLLPPSAAAQGTPPTTLWQEQATAPQWRAFQVVSRAT